MPAPNNQAAPEPFIPAGTIIREFTARSLILGTILGMVFGASSLYLVLKVGITVSASIPVAVISLAFFRVLSKVGFRDATILENNLVQTAGSAGESIAFGVPLPPPVDGRHVGAHLAGEVRRAAVEERLHALGTVGSRAELS